MQIDLRSMVLLIVVGVGAASPVRAQGDLLRLSGQTLAAMQEAHGALSDLQSVREIVRAIEEDRAPSTTVNQWADLAERYRHAATQLASSPMPTDFDPAPYRVSVAQLANCDTRDASLVRLRGYATQMNDALRRGQDSLADLERASADLIVARRVLGELIDVHSRLAAVPIYGQIFQWDWLELNTNVSASLAALESAVTARRARVIAATRAITAYVANLQPNVAALESMRCTLAGQWTGAMVANNWTVPMTLTFQQVGSEYTCIASFSGSDQGCSAVRLGPGRSMSFRLEFSDFPMDVSGTVSTDYRSVVGTFTSEPANGTWRASRP